MPPTRPLVVLLRGINVGRANRLAMADFRAVLTELGLQDVQTVLQSGNAIGRAGGDPADHERTVHDALAARGLTVAVLVREVADLALAVDQDPLAVLATDPSRHLIGFLAEPLTADARTRLTDALQTAQDSVLDAGDRFAVVGDHVFLWCPHGVSRSPFGTVPWPARAGVVATLRNARTVRSLLDRAAALG
ncbi:DUF1697 domain-containing protein [Nakamurella flavida]|uniref:DUF1697 domain-containing protein n=1 Tax=Nakamurella flavida TaxID=363630 RepID=A0A938YCZ3_9ACTN|nr:DUF1697 domain-containing protein [Nakamurella flavida]MBM9475386.1 DUF1697 domain-containing protein [Nakamurella flavida]MDP9776966.1 uncharacterized protein (DUF1697 family) [Nakamurella flavida]